MFGKVTCFTLLTSLLVSQFAYAANPEAAKAVATSICASYHGAKGISPVGTFPNLAGQKADYLAAQLKAFRSKTRNNPVMSPMAADLKDEEIDNLAAYFARLKACE
jgi:cytochrome c553